jgi:hypothetical protein
MRLVNADKVTFYFLKWDWRGRRHMTVKSVENGEVSFDDGLTQNLKLLFWALFNVSVSSDKLTHFSN